MAATREFVRDVPREQMADSVSNVRVTMEHFEQALSEVNPSVTDEVRDRYEEIEQRFERGEVSDEGETVGRTFQ